MNFLQIKDIACRTKKSYTKKRVKNVDSNDLHSKNNNGELKL